MEKETDGGLMEFSDNNRCNMSPSSLKGFMGLVFCSLRLLGANKVTIKRAARVHLHDDWICFWMTLLFCFPVTGWWQSNVPLALIINNSIAICRPVRTSSNDVLFHLRHYASQTKTMLPTRKCVPGSCRQSDHTKTS